jgi:nucleoid-associated protein YgaU
MFECTVDIEHPFGQASIMARTRVRRRRFAAVAAVVTAVALGAPAVANAFDAPGSGPPARRYVVRGGDTLWDVAVRLAPDEDPRDVVARLAEANGLDGASIVPGQVLVLDVVG